MKCLVCDSLCVIVDVNAQSNISLNTLSKINKMYSVNRLRKVYLNADVYAVCLQHALSTEKEEVMGLLIGEVDEENRISHISSCLILRRSDKQADRVEISPEQLMAATNHAEELAKKLKRPMRVNGWYHSHPHITVWPSRVDVGTQDLYQQMDCYFVGLIFSVFPNETRNNENYSKSNEVQLTCFQAQGGERLEIPIYIKPTEFKAANLEMMAELPKILREEEKEIAAKYLNATTDVDPLNVYHNLAHNLAGKVNITEKVARPIYEAALARHRSNLQRIEYLKKENAKMRKQLDELKAKCEVIVID